MEKRRLGKTDMLVAPLGFGGAEIGYEKTDQGTVERLLNAALDAGLNVIDTAECYMDSEEQIGKAVAGRRKDYYLFTKCGHITPDGRRGDAWNAEGVTASIERSLRRLRMDAVDLVQLHSCTLEVLKRGEVIEAMERAKKAGKTRSIGYSGDRDAGKFAVECGRFDTLQTSLSIADQEAIELTLPLAREKNMGVILKRPLANAAWRHDQAPGGYADEYWKRLQKLAYDFCTGAARERTGPDGAAGIALRFAAFQPGVHVALVGTSKPERWRENAQLLAAGPLAPELNGRIRARWKEVAGPDWVGET